MISDSRGSAVVGEMSAGRSDRCASMLQHFIGNRWGFLLSLTAVGLIPAVLLQKVPHQYHLIKTPMTWPAAQNICREMYTDLATVESDDDWVTFTDLLTSEGITSALWIGLYNDINSWRWSYNEVPLQNSTFSSWGDRNPDNNYGYESCGIINSDGLWWDTYCHELRPFICYNSSISGPGRFIGITSPMLTWSEARVYCREFHTDLPTATGSPDNDLLAQLASGHTQCYWIGLYRETWKWSDGTKISNLRWTNGQPNNLWKNENCGLHYKLLEDFTCSYQFIFMCHTIPTVREQQIVRLQMKSDGRVFEHDTQMAIVEAIKRNLEEHGMLNTRVTLRVQPDGNFIYKNS